MTKRPKNKPGEPNTQRSTKPKHADGGTKRPEAPALEGRKPLPEEITGRASGTDESLVTLFDSAAAEHLSDGFHGGTGDIPEGTDSLLDADEADDADGVTPVRPIEPDGTRD